LDFVLDAQEGGEQRLRRDEHRVRIVRRLRFLCISEGARLRRRAWCRRRARRACFAFAGVVPNTAVELRHVLRGGQRMYWVSRWRRIAFSTVGE
jgi:hypothetical protein